MQKTPTIIATVTEAYTKLKNNGFVCGSGEGVGFPAGVGAGLGVGDVEGVGVGLGVGDDEGDGVEDIGDGFGFGGEDGLLVCNKVGVGRIGIRVRVV